MYPDVPAHVVTLTPSGHCSSLVSSDLPSGRFLRALQCPSARETPGSSSSPSESEPAALSLDNTEQHEVSLAAILAE